MQEIKLLKTVADGTEVYLREDGVIEFIADADIDSDGGPNVDHDPCWQSETTLKRNGKSINAQQVPYAVIPIGILNLVGPMGLGCKVVCTHMQNGKSAVGVLADLGPTKKTGEMSPAMARLLGINPNSCYGGEDKKVIKYEIYIGVPAVVNDITYNLQHL